MIQIKAIDGAPEKTPDTKFGSNFDGEFFYFWENEKELAAFKEQVEKEAGNDNPPKQDASAIDADTIPVEEVQKIAAKIDVNSFSDDEIIKISNRIDLLKKK